MNQIKWWTFIQNHAYGIKRFVLKEEAYIPSEGYEDLRNRIFMVYPRKLINPMASSSLFHKKIKSYEDTKKLVFGSKAVRDAI